MPDLAAMPYGSAVAERFGHFTARRLRCIEAG
jgi:hypothetical protein